MFTGAIASLIEALPDLEGLDQASTRRLLTRAWLEVAERRELAGAERDEGSGITDLRRLATALQVHAVLAPALPPEAVRACSFVAAEALDIARELDELEGTAVPIGHERILVGLLYLIAGYDANASVAIRGVDPASEELSAPERYAYQCILAMLGGTQLPDPPAAEGNSPPGYLHEQVRGVLWRNVGDAIRDFTLWLRTPALADTNPSDRLVELADLLRLDDDSLPIAVHADIQHLARVAAVALQEAANRALRTMPAPDTASEAFEHFLEDRCPKQPLVWPAAAEYASRALPGPTVSAIVAVPTGAGKSGVADLAIQHAIPSGWVLYLAPTNALVGQIRRQLRRDHPGVTIREFLGGAEYSTLGSEDMSNIAGGEVLVMTPEKCSLALRQFPTAFADLSLVVFDEAHLLGERRGRGALSELVLAEIMSRAEGVAFLMMSALIANPDQLAAWLREAHEREVDVISEPWRPTRTLRAIVGIDRVATMDAAAPAAEELESLHPTRRNVSFGGKLAVLAGLQGPWGTREADDYALIRIGATTSMNVTRPRGGGQITVDAASANTRATVESLAQLLGERGQRVIAFLPRSKHDSFAAALAMPGFPDVVLDPAVEAFLDLAEAELGVHSRLEDALARGVAVHTSALLSEERRASEIAFDDGGATVLFATGTLAQGLNLPATTVIIGGTDIGYDPDSTEDEKRRQARSQLLNAIGRAGRARVAARSIALVVPNRLPVLDASTLVQNVLPRAEFLAEEDASTSISSALRPLVRRALEDDIDPAAFRVSDHIALAYLAPTENGEDSGAILRRTWGAYQAGDLSDIESLVKAIDEAGRSELESNDGPDWAADAARRAGVALPIAAHFANSILAMIREDVPSDLDGWLLALLTSLAALPNDQLGLLLNRGDFRSTAVDQIWSDDPEERASGHDALRTTLEKWLSGKSLAEVGGAAHGTDPFTQPGRGQRDPLPRTIRVVNNGIEFGITRAAGLIAAVTDAAIERAEIEPISAAARAAMERLPLALRLGASDQTALGFLRAGARPRAVAHALAEIFGPAPLVSDDDIRSWAADRLNVLSDHLLLVTLEPATEHLLESFLACRDQR